MTRIRYLAALGAALFAGMMIGWVGRTQLHAQVQDPLCGCPYWDQGTAGTIPCVGSGSLGTPTCSFVGSYCFLTGTGSWTPTSPTCAVNDPYSGAVKPFIGGSGGPYWFNAGTTQPSIPWGIISNPCDSPGNPFGPEMRVIYKHSTSGCSCDGNLLSTMACYYQHDCNAL
jgi:hypothetical protein